MIFALTNCQEPGADKVINIAAIQGVSVPSAGGTPVTEITPTPQYTGTIIWSPIHTVFQNSTVYFATITITPKKGYILQGVTTDFFKVPGASTVGNDENSGVITAVFPRTAGTFENPAVIYIKTIEGITPKSWETPKTTINPTAQYTGTVTWSPFDNPFKSYAKYTATISLTPRVGFTITGVKADFFTVSGATTVNNDANSNIVTAEFDIDMDNIDMVSIPGGSFQMGSTVNTNEQPVHTVTLSAFKMGKYEVTQEQWTAVMGSNPSSFTGSPASGEVQDKRPVERVSWYDALVFCNKLSMREGLSPAYRISGSTDPANWGNVPTSANNTTWDAVQIVAGSDGYRLPTEAQWEYAARGGNGSPENYTYSGSNTVDDVAWYGDNSGSKTHEVGKKTPNVLGLYDMSGNVWKWCWDWYGGIYWSDWQTDPMGESLGCYRMNRGGIWDSLAGYMYSAIRYSDPPYDRSRDLGFRLIRP